MVTTCAIQLSIGCH